MYVCMSIDYSGTCWGLCVLSSWDPIWGGGRGNYTYAPEAAHSLPLRRLQHPAYHPFDAVSVVTILDSDDEGTPPRRLEQN